MKKPIILFAALCASISSLFTVTSIGKKEANAAGETPITINKVELASFKDNNNRICLNLYNAEGVTILNGSGRRNGYATAYPTVCINGYDYQYGRTEGNDYLATFGQADSVTYFPVFIKRNAGTMFNGNSWFSSDYPEIPTDEDTTLVFYKDSCFGVYKFTQTVTILIDHLSKKLTMVSNPTKISITGGSSSDIYIYNGTRCVNSGSTVTITPTGVIGQVDNGLKFTNSDGEEVQIEYTKNQDGTYSFTMPNYQLNVEVLYKEVSYQLTLGDTTIEVSFGKVIGDLPEGRWSIDGFEISKDSFYMWKEDKVATKLEDKPSIGSYTIECYVDGELLDTISFTDNDISVTLPVIPYKEGYRIVGWDLETLEYKNLTTNAIYELIEG